MFSSFAGRFFDVEKRDLHIWCEESWRGSFPLACMTRASQCQQLSSCSRVGYWLRQIDTSIRHTQYLFESKTTCSTQLSRSHQSCLCAQTEQHGGLQQAGQDGESLSYPRAS